MAISLFSKFVENDNDKIRKRIKNLLYIYKRSIKNIKMKYFFIFYYNSLKLKLSEYESKSKILENKRFFVKNKSDKKNIFNKTFNFPIRTIFHNSTNTKNDNNLFKSKRLKIVSDSKYDCFNNIEYKVKKSGYYKKKNSLLNNNSLNISLKNRTFQNNFQTNLSNKNKNIIFNYINDMKNYKRKLIEEKKLIPAFKMYMTPGNKTTTNKDIFENMKVNNNKRFFNKNLEGFRYDYKRNIKNEEEKNNDIKNNQTIHINNYYILNSSFLNENHKKFGLNELYEKEYDSSFIKNHQFQINTPNEKLKNGFKHIKTKMNKISQNIKREIFNQINKKSDIQYKCKNINYKDTRKRFPLSYYQTMKNFKLKKKNKQTKFIPILEDRMKNIININKHSDLNKSNKKNNLDKKINNDNIFINTRNIFDNYNNSLLTTFYKERKNGKDINDSEFFSTAKDTSKKNSLIYKINLTNYKSKLSSNKKQLNEVNIQAKNIGDFSISSNKKSNSSNKKKQIIFVRNNSYIGKIKNKKENLINNNIIIQNLSFSNCSEHNNKSANRKQNLIQNYKNRNEIKIIDKIGEENKNVAVKEKVIETSSETLSDSKIYELAKNYIQNNEESIDKHTMEEILKNKRHKK